MNPTCDDARSLVPSYLDGELSEEQASPLRAHLLSCPACREVAKDGKSLHRWFVEEPVPSAPPGFSARVARRAFAGDPGITADAEEAVVGGASILPFVLTLTAVAAAALFLFSVMIQVRNLPGSDSPEMHADTVWRNIYQLDPDGDLDAEEDDEDAQEEQR